MNQPRHSGLVQARRSSFVQQTSAAAAIEDAPPPANARRAIRRSASGAIPLMLFGMFLFSINDVLGKWLVGTYSPMQVILVRSIFALVVLMPWVAQDGVAKMIRLERPLLQLTRVFFSTVDVICFYVAVIYLPLADVMAFYMAAPIFIAAMSPFLLGERVGWRRWSAILVGFVGVLIALAPSASSLEIPALVSLLGCLCFSLMFVTTRSLGKTSDKVLATWQIGGLIVAGAMGAPFAWTPPSLRDYALMAVLGIVSMAAYLCVNRALKLAPAASVSPYQYTMIVWAIILGYPAFGDVPSLHMLVGAAIIIASGLFIFWRQRQLAAR